MTEPRAVRAVQEPADPGIEQAGRFPRRRSFGQGPVMAVVALGGAIGSAARYGASLVWPTAPGAFPWTTLLVNATGCAVIGVFMVVITDVWAAHRLVRPFIGTGILGGFTTFSTYAVDVAQLVGHGRTGPASACLAATPVSALAGVWAAAAATRGLISAGRRTKEHGS
ncbi:fluoride efflux transporter FluC [Streptomyces sp. NPDC001262]|uniref:fluoride efflux transporter FluC n=1 Tax=unclassified Streptomyces TaxID=2593676 RepID=UPI0036C5956B